MPFKSEKQRKFLYANKPEVAKKLSYADGGSVPSTSVLEDAIRRNTTLQGLSHLRAGGMVGTGSKRPKNCRDFQALMHEKSSKGS